MLLQRFSRPGLTAVSLAASRRAYSVVSPLAYDLHEPPKPKFDEKHSPILFLHGLFGSKKNNRAMSKYVHTHSLTPTELS
jgi:hypothetical protein